MAEAELQDAAAWFAGGSRRVLLGRFPYALVYREVFHDQIEIVAVAHLKRRVSYWADR
jgi:hypothetical protein